jgi:hypothetical protein
MTIEAILKAKIENELTIRKQFGRNSETARKACKILKEGMC